VFGGLEKTRLRPVSPYAGPPPNESQPLEEEIRRRPNPIRVYFSAACYTAVIVDSAWKYRGRVITVEDVAFIRGLIAANTETSRRTLSKKLCEAWGWRQANGALCDMVCRGLLLMPSNDPNTRIEL